VSLFSESVVAGRRMAHRVNNLMWERRLSIDTRGWIKVHYPDAGHYATMNYALVQKVLRHLQLRSDDVFVDIGSGKGRILCCAARFPIAKVVGVDLSTEFCEEAKANAERSRGRRAPIEVHNMLADAYDYVDCSAYYMFSPFGPETIGKVLTKIRKDRDGKPIRVAYANPAYPEAFDEQPWLERYDFWDAAARGEEHSVAFYRDRV
jgi:cyclopropane fatty-acyl-phospholipid synthase-like methyltransferase